MKAKKSLIYALTLALALFFAADKVLADVKVDVDNDNTNNVTVTGGSANQSQSQSQSQNQSSSGSQSSSSSQSSQSSGSVSGGSVTVSQSQDSDVDVDIDKDGNRHYKSGKSGKKLPAAGSNTNVLFGLILLAALSAVIGVKKYSSETK